MSNLLADLKEIMDELKIETETGVYKKTPAPDRYTVLVPLSDEFFCADDGPENDVQAVRVSVYSKTNYISMARAIILACAAAGIVISDRRYIGHEDDTGYHHYAIDVEQNYNWEEE